MRNHRQSVNAGVRAARSDDAAVLARQVGERGFDGRLYGALAERLPLPAQEAAAVELERQLDAPPRPGDGVRGRQCPTRAAAAVGDATGTNRRTRPSSGTMTVPTPAMTR